MGAQDIILGSRVAHLRELKAENAKLKAENASLRAQNAELQNHLDLAILAAEDLPCLPHNARMIIIDGWNVILGSQRIASSKAELIAKAEEFLAKNTRDIVWIVFDGPQENVANRERLRISYTGGSGAHRADRFICDFLRMARFRGEVSRVAVLTCDKDFQKIVSRCGATIAKSI